MKIKFVVILFLFFVLSSVFGKTKIPERYATKVNNVNDAYTADSWIVSPDEEPAGDQNVSNAPECDIRGTIACYDNDYLRVDILLNNPISYDFKVWYAVKFVYAGDMEEWYTYYPVTKKFIYEKFEDGEITETIDLTEDSKEDACGVTSQDKDVYLIINKDKHFGGDKGKIYYLETYFMSGFVDKKGKMQKADETIDVNLNYKR